MSGSVPEKNSYRMRFEFRVTTYFNVDARQVDFELSGRPAVLKAVEERPLKDADAVTIQVGGFQDEDEARHFGYRLQRAATLAATKSNRAIDVGRNRNRTAASAKMREDFYKKHGRELRNRVHGIDVFKEHPPVHIVVVKGFGTVRIAPEGFLRELDTSFRTWDAPTSPQLEHALRLRAEANLTGDHLARMIMAIAAVEALTPDEPWTEKQKEILKWFSTKVQNFAGASEREIVEIVERVTGQRKLAINQGFRRLFDRLGVQHLWPEWRDIYNLRSRILHGDTPREKALDVIDDTLRLSRIIVLAAAAQEIPGDDATYSKA